MAEPVKLYDVWGFHLWKDETGGYQSPGHPEIQGVTYREADEAATRFNADPMRDPQRPIQGVPHIGTTYDVYDHYPATETDGGSILIGGPPLNPRERAQIPNDSIVRFKPPEEDSG